MLQVADVDKLRCNFVFDVFQYFDNKKYSITSCNATVIKSFLDFKLSEYYLCPLDLHEDCRLQLIKANSEVVTCNPEAFVCSLQAGIKLTKTETLTTYTTTLENQANGSAFPVVEINSGIYPKASINFVTRDQFGNIYDTHQVTSGSIHAGGIEYIDQQHDLGGLMVKQISNVVNSVGSYVKKIRLYRTDTSGIYTGEFANIDVSPLTSTHLNSY
jgi:hypothetical protein